MKDLSDVRMTDIQTQKREMVKVKKLYEFFKSRAFKFRGRLQEKCQRYSQIKDKNLVVKNDHFA